MSGSGGGGWPTEPTEDCAKLAQSTTLNSPNKAVVATLKKGDRLEIRIQPSGKAMIIEALHQGQVAGTITSSIIQRLAECMQKGFKYEAEVTDEVKGGACKVHVHAK